MQVTIISTVYPYPLDDGKKVMLSGLLDFFISSYGKENITYILIGEKEIKPHYNMNIVTIEKPNIVKCLWNILWYSLIRQSKSIQESVLYSNIIMKKIDEIIKENKSELILADTVRIGQYINNKYHCKIKKVLYMDDLFSIRYQKILETMAKVPEVKYNLLGKFSKFIPGFLQPLMRFNWIQKKILVFEKKTIEKNESLSTNNFDKCLLINGEEARILSEKTNCKSVFEIKPFMKNINVLKRNYEGQATFIFLGALNIPHNKVSIIYFIKTQMDSIIKKIPNVKLRIIGKGASTELVSLVEKYRNNISLEGYIDNLELIFKDACAIVIPLLFGTGVKLKTLEAMSYGLPIIATNYGVEGIAVTNLLNCVVENDLGNYTGVMEQLLDIEYNESISIQARNFYAKNYSEDVIVDHYNTIFNAF